MTSDPPERLSALCTGLPPWPPLAIPPGFHLRDQQFDELLEPEWCELSLIHWTPFEICVRVASLLSLGPTERVLDIGSGVGKLCILGSSVSHGAFVGVEQRKHLVLQAERVATQLGSTAQFIHGNALELDWSSFDALYFYNPFDELRFHESFSIDSTVRFGDDLFRRDVDASIARLRSLAVGTRVVTYHGLGAPMPDSYRRVTGAEDLWLWTKESDG